MGAMLKPSCVGCLYLLRQGALATKLPNGVDVLDIK